jgi:hypothetical protein
MSVQVVPFTNGMGSDPLDRLGQEVLAKLQYAAGLAEQNTQHVLSMAQEAATQLRIAEDKVAGSNWKYGITSSAPNARRDGCSGFHRRLINLLRHRRSNSGKTTRQSAL